METPAEALLTSPLRSGGHARLSGMADAGGMGYPPSPLIGPWPRVFGCGAGVFKHQPFLIVQTARAVRMTSAAMGCTAGARQTAMTAISQMIGPPRGPFPESRISAPFRWAAPRLARQRRPAVAGRSLSTRANGRRSTGTMVSANMESAGWRRANFFPFSRRCATTSSGRWPRPVGCP